MHDDLLVMMMMIMMMMMMMMMMVRKFVGVAPQFVTCCEEFLRQNVVSPEEIRSFTKLHSNSSKL